jgi:hypothetical protein
MIRKLSVIKGNADKPHFLAGTKEMYEDSRYKSR